jgi:hypothetical protein
MFFGGFIVNIYSLFHQEEKIRKLGLKIQRKKNDFIFMYLLID